ncbi:MAG: elongation factor P [Acidobacteria bacterium]|nr:elongation factor P [Acidobacteriota bacterium]
MIEATELRTGTVLQFEGELHRVVEAAYHAGGGKLTGVVHARLRNLRTGTLIERRFRPDDRVNRVDLERSNWQFLYDDGTDFYFMNPQTYEQIGLPRSLLGEASRFLQPEMAVSIETYDGRPVNVVFPEAVDLRVTATAQPAHQQQTSTLKSATLENGLEVLVPLFIKEGDSVRVEVSSGKYLERARSKSEKER